MKKFLKRIIVCLICSFCFCAPVFAEDSSSAPSIKISPVNNYFIIKAEDVQKYFFEIENTSSEKFSFKVYTAPYNVVGEDYVPSFTEETSYNKITDWITFEDDKGEYVKNAVYSVEPGESKRVNYKVSVPSDIPGGSQYCLIFAETINKKAVTGTSIRTVSRVAHIVVGHGIGEANDTAEITDFHLTGVFTKSEVSAYSKVKNSGNIDFLAAYTFKIETLFGKNLYEDSKTFTIFPETERKFSSSWEDAPLFGVFKVRYFVNANGVTEEKTHILFIIPTFILIILLLLLTGIAIWIIIMLKKRKERKSRLVI